MDQSEIAKDFVIESNEILDQVDLQLVELESSPGDTNVINSIFRTIHSIKGAAGFLGFEKLQSITHIGENILDKLRAGKIVFSSDVATALLQLADAAREILSNVYVDGKEGETDYSELINVLTVLNNESETRVIKEESQIEESGEEEPPTEIVSMEDKKTAKKKSRVAQPSQTETENLPPEKPIDEDRATQTDTSLRVEVSALDKLMNLVGELVLARNQILQFSSVYTDPSFLRTTQRINLITSELQDQVMQTRMQPIANIWNRFPRVVRDLAKNCNKKVSLVMEGKETDLDKTLIEAIKDPLTHIVRNAVDHGIEAPEVRAIAGKFAEGVITLRAYHEGGQVIIQISDDGAGLDADKIKAKAVEKGVIKPERAARMSQQEAFKLIFIPGFSTAAQVTNISGRGVGMDVVKSNIESIGGSVDLTSSLGQGTTLTVKIPLTLAIIPALLVLTGSQRFAIPQVSLLELVRVEESEIADKIERIQDSSFYRLRGDLLPLVYLDKTLGIDHKCKTDHGVEIEEDVVNIVVLQSEGQQFGLVVDGISDTEEIVVKPLGKLFKNLSVFAGATIMGDGRVALIMDVLGLARRVHIEAEQTRKDEFVGESAAEVEDDGAADRETLLIISLAESDRMAIPLSIVDRLEEFANTSVEHIAGRNVVQYRGGVLPLVDVGLFFTGTPVENEGNDDLKQVIVYSENGKSVGLVVGNILDIVNESFTVEQKGIRNGIYGSAVIQDRITDLLDVEAIVRSEDATFFEAKKKFTGAELNE